MKYEHPTIEIEQPAPGHYSVSGIPAAQTFIEGTGRVVAPSTLYISPAVPDELLEHILADRRAQEPTGSKVARLALQEEARHDAAPLDQDTPLDHGPMPQGAPREVAPEAHTTAPAKPRRGRPAKGVTHK